MYGIIRPARRAGPSPRRAASGRGLPGPAGRDRFTLRHDLDGHGCLDVLGSRDLDGHDDSDVRGGRFALCSRGPRGFVRGTCRLGPGPCGDVMGGRFAPDPAARVGTCGGRAARPAAREGRDRPDVA